MKKLRRFRKTLIQWSLPVFAVTLHEGGKGLCDHQAFAGFDR
jgi:hypothetical protein